MKRRSWILVLLACSSVSSAHAAQSAVQGYPARPIRVIAAQSAGSSLDTIVRIVTPRLSELLGQQLVIDNRGGAGGTIGVELAARAAPDGYTALVGASSSMIVSRFTYRSLPFDVLRDFDAVSNLVNADAVLVVHPSVAAKSVKELVALAISSKQRSLLLPDLPTVDEAGVTGYEYGSWNGVFVPRGTPKPIVRALHASIQKALADPDVVKAYGAQGMAPAGSESPEAFAKYFRGDFERITKLVQIAGIKPE